MKLHENCKVEYRFLTKNKNVGCCGGIIEIDYCTVKEHETFFTIPFTDGELKINKEDSRLKITSKNKVIFSTI